MSSRLLRASLSGFVIAVVSISHSLAHEIVGNRFFPATLTIDDPGVNDELAVPTVDSFNTADVPPIKQRDISAELSKRITEDFAISLGSAYTFLSPTDPTAPSASGFQNLETTFKYRLFKSPEHEFVFSAGLAIEWGGTGSANVGAEAFHSYVPNIYFGKGLGDLPDIFSWIRPLAITGQIGYSVPARNFTTAVSIDADSGALTSETEFHPRVLNWGGTIQYSMPYLKAVVIDRGLPDVINRLIPLVEANLQTPVANTFTSGTLTTGTINPGIIWVGNTFQFGVEALIPINRQSGSNIGVIAQLHYYLDDIDPRGIGKPIFGGPVQPASPFPR